MDHFLRHGMPLMDKVFNEMRNDCTALLKNMQLCTRYLQHVCSFSRGKSDAALAAHIPPLRKLLEQFVFRVKAMLALNNSLEAFWLGNLKNRDLAGKELNSSQIVEEVSNKINSFLKQCFSFYENKVLQLMSAEASLERFGEKTLFS